MTEATINRPVHGELLPIDREDAEERIHREASTPEIARHALEMAQRGFTIISNSVSEQACDEAIQAFEIWCEKKGEEAASRRDEFGLLPRVVNLHIDAPKVARLFYENSLALEVQNLCFGYRTALYTSLFFHRGSGQPLHRDVPYFCTEPINFYFGMWIALEDTDEGNGPLTVAEGGHRIPEIDLGAIRAAHQPEDTSIAPVADDLWAPYQNEVRAHCQELGISLKKVSVKKGSTVLWHPLTPHGGSRILDEHRTRFSIAFHTTPEHVPVYQANVFFQPEKIPSPDPRWSYRRVGDRMIADHLPAKFQL